MMTSYLFSRACLYLPRNLLSSLLIVTFGTQPLFSCFAQHTQLSVPARDCPHPTLVIQQKVDCGDLILVTTEILDHEGFAVLDSGTSRNILDESIFTFEISEMSQVSRKLTIDKPVAVEAVVCDRPYSIGDYTILNLGNVSRSLGKRVLCVLGTPSLGNSILEYESSANTFFLNRLNPRELSNASQVELIEADGCYFTDGIIIPGVEKCTFLIDTGFNQDLSLGPVAFEAAKKSVANCEIATSQKVLRGNSFTSVRYGTLRSASIWGERFENIAVSEGENKVGLGLLRRFDFRMDFRNKLLSLEKASNQEELHGDSANTVLYCQN